MAPLPWLILLENFAYQALMKSPAFHRAVEGVVKTVHRARHGIPPDELGGTRIDDPNSKFGQHFMQEIRSQLGTAEKERVDGTRLQSPSQADTARSDPVSSPRTEDAESAWQELLGPRSEQKQSFTGNYLEALRGQVNQKKPPS